MPLLGLVIPLKILVPAWTLIGIVAGTALIGSDRKKVAWAEMIKLDFVANVSHELRTPIASIVAAAETLESGEPDREETGELVGLIRRQSDRMKELARCVQYCKDALLT